MCRGSSPSCVRRVVKPIRNARFWKTRPVWCFLEHYLEDFATKHDRDKLIHVLRRTWRKMGKQGKQAVAGLSLSPAAADLLAEVNGDMDEKNSE